MPSRPGAKPRLPTARRIGGLFMVGSAGFALASLPFAADLAGTRVVGVTYFVASIFFTAAAFEQLRACHLATLEWWSAATQLLGTLFFNISTFYGMAEDLSGPRTDLLVWSPDAFGSVAFLVASALAVKEARGHRIAERVSWENMIGSIAFAVSAVAAYVVPDTNEALNASAASSFTLVGALLFFRAAQLLPRTTAQSRLSPRTSARSRLRAGRRSAAP